MEDGKSRHVMYPGAVADYYKRPQGRLAITASVFTHKMLRDFPSIRNGALTGSVISGSGRVEEPLMWSFFKNSGFRLGICLHG